MPAADGTDLQAPCVAHPHCAAVQIAPTEIRGALGSVNQLVICLGILFALVANIYVPAAQWRKLFWMTMGPAILLGFGE